MKYISGLNLAISLNFWFREFMFDFASPFLAPGECYLDTLGMDTFHRIAASGVVGWKMECSSLRGVWKQEGGQGGRSRTMLGWDRGRLLVLFPVEITSGGWSVRACRKGEVETKGEEVVNWWMQSYLYAEYIMRKVGLDEKHKLESRLPGEISITSDTQRTPPLWQKVKRN